jgi:hypothetical protein
MDERSIGAQMAGAGAQGAMEVPACLGVVQGAGSEPRIPPLAAGGKAHAADEFTQHFRSVVVVALHETTKLVAAEDVHDVVVFHRMTASACPGVAEGGEHADSHANAGDVLEGLVTQAEGGGEGDSVEPHAAGSGQNAELECLGPVDGLKAQQLCVTGCVEGPADERGQQSVLGAAGTEKPSAGGRQ